MRKAPALLLSAGLLMATLTGCAPSAADACVPTAPDGAASELIEVSGEFGSAPEVNFPTPLKSAKTQRTVVIDGDDDDARVLTGNQSVRMSVAVYDGETGEPVPEAQYGEPTVYATSDLNPEITKALSCATPGSRIAMAIPQGESSAIVVADVHDVFLEKANGAIRPIVEPGFPSVVTAGDGTPGLTIPKTDPPSELKVAVLKAGDGEEVAKTTEMIVHYTGALWSERTIFDSSWEKGTPATFAPDGVIPGLATALVGQKVGSQVLVVIPPELAYGEEANEAVPANSTLIFVVDILGTLP